MSLRFPEVDLRGVVLRLLWLLPLCLAAWYLAAPALSWIAGQVARPAIAFAVQGTAVMRPESRDLAYAVAIDAPYTFGKSLPRAHAEIAVAAATYTFGIALFVALCLAEPRTRRLMPLLLGSLIMVLLPAWGIAFDALKQLGATRELVEYLGWSPAWRNAVALGYQVGALLLPTLAPVAAWLVTLSRPSPRGSPQEPASAPTDPPPRS